jgi:hypothetical protein
MKENKLFIICPFSNIEHFLRKEYGDDILFMTYSAGIIQYDNIDFLSSVKDIIINEKINKIFFVNDIKCRFINNTLQKNNDQSYAFQILQEYYVSHYFSMFHNQSLQRQQYNLAKINLFMQIQEFSNSYIFKELIELEKTEIQGIITDKFNNLKKEIKNKVYEF